MFVVFKALKDLLSMILRTEICCISAYAPTNQTFHFLTSAREINSLGKFINSYFKMSILSQNICFVLIDQFYKYVITIQ